MPRTGPERTLQERLTEADPAAGTAERLSTLDERALLDLAAVVDSPQGDALGVAAPSRTGAPLAATNELRRHASRPARPAVHRLAVAAGIAVMVAGTAVLIPQVSGTSPAVEVSAARVAQYEQSSADPETLTAMPSTVSFAAVSSFATPAALAAESDLVALARFERVQRGRANTVGGESAWVTTVMVLRDVQVVQGELPPEFDGKLYVELPLMTGFTDLQGWQQAGIPEGTPALVYVRSARDGSDEPGQPSLDNILVDPLEGRPAGQSLYQAYYPEGLAVQAAGEVVAWPGMRVSMPGTLGQALPDGELVPHY